jgi:hypothetical protein
MALEACWDDCDYKEINISLSGCVCMALDPYCSALHFSLQILQDSGSMPWAPVPLLWQLDIVGVAHFKMCNLLWIALIIWMLPVHPISPRRLE